VALRIERPAFRDRAAALFGSAMIMSPGATGIPAQTIGWLTRPGNSLVVPFMLRLRAKTGKFSSRIAAPSRAQPSIC